MTQNKDISSRYLLILLIALVAVRLISLGLYPLADTTEARYGEIARIMAATGDWITPRISLDVPFWGKPPLSFWLTAVGFKVLGIHESVARLPSLVINSFILIMVWMLADLRKGRRFAGTASLILGSSLLFWIAGGAVMTDSCLACATTLCMVAFWKAMNSEKFSRCWGYLFFTGLAMGLLAKGPVALVLIGFPIVVWAVACGRIRELFSGLPWIGGTLLTLILTIPWYAAAEWKTPGFLEYFFVGEHWNRFLVPGWKGDLYGSAHGRPRGTIWLYWLGSAFPWSIILPGFLVKKRICKMGHLRSEEGWYLYLILWSITPMLFFTFAGNILPAYVLPGMPAFALLGAEILLKKEGNAAPKWILTGGCFMLAVFIIAAIVVAFGVGPAQKSQKQLVRTFDQSFDVNVSRLTYLFKKPFSADFYSRGTAGILNSPSGLADFLNDSIIDAVAVRKKYFHEIPGPLLDRFDQWKEINGYILLREKADSP